MKVIGGIRAVLRAWVYYVDPLHFHYLEQAHRDARALARLQNAALEGLGLEEAAQEAALLHTDSSTDVATTFPVDAAEALRPRWRAPITVLSHDAVPTVTLVACWSMCKDPLHPESNEDTAVWVADRQVAAVFDGATESFAARRWVNIVSSGWESGSPLDLGALQQEYSDDINAMELSWAQESAAGRGSFTTVASIEPAPGGLAATCVGDSAILLVKNGAIVQAYPSIDPADYSSVPDALGSTTETLPLGQELIQTCSWTIPLEPDEFDVALLATDAVAVWLLQGNEAQPNERLTSARAVSDDAAWEDLVTHERQSGRMKTDDSTLMVVNIEVPT